MQYNDSTHENIPTGLEPNILFAKVTVSHSFDFSKFIRRTCDKSMMGVTIEWKGSKAIMRGPIESILGYCIRSGILRHKVVDKKVGGEENENGISSVFFYNYNWVEVPLEEMKQFIFKELSG